jgi:hypothetical protein
VASIYAICQPTSCNPSPINEIGLFGTGLPLSSNKVTVSTPGTASDYLWFGAPGKSKYIVPVELLTGTVGSTIRLPYVPNSMIMDRLANNIFFGSDRGLMVVATASGLVSKQEVNVPGIVLAVSPNSGQVLVNDQIRQVFYIYGTGTGVSATTGGMGTAAAWTPDSKTLYITDSASAGPGHSNTLYVYDGNTGWTTCKAGSPCAGNFAGAKNLALTIPSVGAYLSGNPTVSRTWCPTGTVGDYAGMTFYPQGDSVSAQTDVLASTTDGKHMLGAAVNAGGIILTDIGVNIPTIELTAGFVTPIPCPKTTDPGTKLETLSALTTNPTLNGTFPMTVNGAFADITINGIATSPASNLAFLTYSNSGTTTGATLPYYVPGSGQVKYLTLTGAAAITAPVAGAFTPDDKLFFVSTTGDNKIHSISVPLISTDPAHADTQQISPNLPACTPVADLGCTLTAPMTDPVPATVIVIKPRSTT